MTPQQTVQLTQDAQTTFYIVSAVITVVIAIFVRPWLVAHQKQVDQATAAISDSRLRATAQSIVRSLETNPTQASLPGLVQRANGIAALAKQVGISESDAAPWLDDAYNLLTSTGHLVIAPKPATPAPDTTEATSVLDQLKALLAAATQPPSSDPPLSAPAPVPLTPQPSTGGAAVGSVVPISSTGVTLGGVAVPGLPVGG